MKPWFLVAVACACGSPPDRKSTPAASPAAVRTATNPPPTAKSCPALADELGSYLATFNHEEPMFPHVAQRLVTRRELPAVRLTTAPSVIIEGDATLFQGGAVRSLDALHERLVAMRKHIEAELRAGRGSRIDPPDPSQLYVAIEGTVSWKRVVDTVDVMQRAGFTKPMFLFAVPENASPPPPSSVDDELDAIARDDNANKASEVARITGAIVAPCPSLITVFGEVAEHDDKAAFILRSTAPAVAKCKCAVDIPALRSVLWRLLHNPHPVRALPIELDRSAKAISVPATATWQQARERLPSGTTRAWFEVGQGSKR